ncbi:MULTISPECIES: amidohydrolase [Brevibacterium]|jgi:predicted amidohydrolase YtcJ|uniref:Amidohydrolase n=1 Tax=Brevibacterium casei TaxID=33889 RepID=A0A7T4A1H5_9MICO|nr:amidohydrolase [Brevibacterium casei]QQB15579.1 amidohydrolase [Brevibacterium casei]
MRIDAIFTDLDAHTLDPARPRAQRIGVFAGRIVGVDEELDGVTADRVESLGGATVLPGFNDVHCHTTWFGLTLASVDVTAMPGGLPDVYAALEQAAATTPEGEWIEATGFAHRDYDGQYPELARLDAITGSRPLFMRQTSGHAAIVNTEAMRRAGILDRGFTDPVGGKVVRDPAGHPTGLVEETAQGLVQDLIRPYSLDTIVEALDLATTQYAKEGITSFGECGIAYGWIGHSPIEISAYLRAREEGRLRARAQLMPQADGLHAIAANPADGFGIGLDAGLRTGLGDDLISIGPVKFFMDGAMSGETAALRENYAGRDHRGYLQADAEVLRRQILDTYASGWSLAVHAIGDAAVDAAIANIVEAQRLHGRRAVPNRIEHAGLVHDEHLATLAEHGIAVTPQAAFAEAIGDGMNRSLGPERRRLLYRAKSFVDAGVLLPGSSDRPCADGTALRGIEAFVTRATRDGDVMGAAAERLTPAEAVAAYTSVAAVASGQGADKGTLTRGKFADFVALDAHPAEVAPDEIAGIPVRATVLGGAFTHDAR